MHENDRAQWTGTGLCSAPGAVLSSLHRHPAAHLNALVLVHLEGVLMLGNDVLALFALVC